MPLRNNFTTAHGSLPVREGAIIEILTTDGLSGYGEIAPLPDFDGVSLSEALAALPPLVESLHKQQLDAALSLLEQTAPIPACTRFGLELALLDLLAQQRQVSLSMLLTTTQTSNELSHTNHPSKPPFMAREIGARFIAPVVPHPRASVPVNAVIGAASLETTVARAQEVYETGFRCIKLKVGNNISHELQRIAAVRQAIGPAIHLRLDANEAWSFQQAHTILTRCAEFDIQYVEQPLRREQLEDMRKLRALVPVPIAADEAVLDIQSTHRLLVAEAADVLILKPQLAGGLLESQQILALASQYGVQCVLTNSIETGIGIAGTLHLASASPYVSLECGLATLDMLEDDLIVEKLAVDNGMLAVPHAPGLGVQLDRQALERYRHSSSRRDRL